MKISDYARMSRFSIVTENVSDYACFQTL